MKSLIFLLTVLFTYSHSQADIKIEDKKVLATCSGYHHGSYLDFFENDNTVYIEVSNDGEPDPVWPVYNVVKLRKNYEDTTSNYIENILEAIRAMKSEESFSSYIKIEADGPNKSKMYLNINNFFGDSFLVINGSVEPIVCTTEIL